jgi:ABC-type polar amino acid transport system ATPase subunit
VRNHSGFFFVLRHNERAASPQEKPVISVANVTKRYGATTVLNQANFTIEKAQLTTILGPSGCGKTTMLRCLNRLERFDQGTITLAGIEVRGHADTPLSDGEEKELVRQVRSRVGLVFQNFNLFPHLTALGNVIEAPMTVRKMTRPQAEEIARVYLQKVGLSGKEQLFPAQLSGGQQQRVAIARALAMEPDVVLFDEPTSALDPRLVREVGALLRSLDDLHKTLVVVSHDMDFARQVSDQVIYFEGGRAVESGTAEQIFSHPQRSETRAFMACLDEEAGQRA